MKKPRLNDAAGALAARLQTPQPGSTHLTEAQARVLATWWGGEYQRLPEPPGRGPVRHGVVFRGQGPGDFHLGMPPAQVVFSLAEVQSLENRRNAFNPGAPDWVG